MIKEIVNCFQENLCCGAELNLTKTEKTIERVAKIQMEFGQTEE